MRVRRWNSSLFVNVPDKPKARKPVKKVSARQAKRTRKLSAMKKQWIAEQFRLQDCCFCQGPCNRPIYDQRDAQLLLSGHHVIHRSLGGTDEPGNILYLCAEDHRKAHLGKGV